MRILLCAQQAPLEPLNGFRLQVTALLAELRQNHDVFVVALTFPDQDQRLRATADMSLLPIRAVTPGGPLARIATAGRGQRWDPRDFAGSLGEAVEQELERFRPDVVHVVGGFLALLWPRLGPDCPAVLSPLDAMHLNTDARALVRAGVRRWLWRREAVRVRRFEAREYARFRRVVVVSGDDAAALTALNPALRPVVIRNGVDAVAFAPRLSTARFRDRVVFAGVMDAAPNVTAAQFLAREVMPHLRAAVPSARLAIVGRRPTAAVRRLSRLPGIEVVGEVDDMPAWLTASSVCVCPMVSGTGIKNKLLEGMACGVPIVATPLALRGTTALPGRDLLVGEGPEQLAAHISFLLRHPRAARSIGAAGRAYVQENHSWKGVADAYAAVYESFSSRPMWRADQGNR
jgi:glycosyltransferase involved in cell wall biosynthesis